nr:Ion transport domain containing protein [Haemonchus contortus]
MFQIITQEGWTDVVVEILRATNESMVPFVAIYFVGYHLLVTLIVLSLFVAVILDNLEMDEELKKVKQLKAREQVTSEFPLPKIRDSFTRQFADDSERCTLESVNDIEPSVNRSILRRGAYIRAQRKVRMRHIGQISSRHIVSSLLDESNRNRALYCDTNQIIPPLGRGMLKSSKGTPMGSRSRGFQSMKGKSHLEGMNENGDVRPTDSAPKKDPKQGEIDIKALQQKRAHAEITRNRIEEEMRENHPLFDRPLFAVGRDSRLRILCQNIVYAQYSPERIDPVTGKQIVLKYKQLHDFIGLMTYLDWAMVFVTSLSCWSMLFESPWPTTGENLIFNNPYLQITEYLYVVSMTFELMVKVIANGLFFTPKAVVKDVGDIMTFFIYFTSVIYLLWMPSHVEINSWAQLLMIMRAMRPLRIYTLVPHIRRVVVELCRGFKEILLVTILLIVLMFVFASFGVQIVGGKLAACNDPTITARWAVLFIHIYVFIGCMIGLTLFVGVVVANYTENRGTALLTVDQRRWHDLKARLKMAQPLHVPPKPPESAKLRSYLYDLTLSKAFKQSFAILVVVNSFTLVVPWNVEEEKQRRNVLFGLTVMSAFCNILFTIEILLKAVAFTVRGFWQSRRNRGDFFITMLGLTWIVFHFLFQVPAYIAGGINEWKRLTYTFGYMVVILRFFTIAGRKSTLKMLMLTVLMSMVRSLFIIAAMFLLVLFYAYTGVILFGMVKYGQAVSKHVNFRNGREALVVLFRSVTGEDWNDIMHDCMRSPPFCYWAEGLNYWETDCGNYFGAILYFCSFYLIITYIVLNVLVAIIMENFSLFYSSEEDALLSYADIRNFQQVWNYVDADQKRSIPTRRVKFLLRLLRGRLEVDPNKDRLLFKHMCYEMERLHNGEDVSFHDVLNMLSYRSVDIRKSLQLEELLQREELEYLIEEEVAKQTIRAWLESCLRRIKQKQNVGQSESTVPTVLPLHRLSCLAPHVPHTPSQHNLVSAHIISPQAAQNFESFESRESVEEENGSKKRQRRRNSIPELVGEAKKFMFGSLAKRLEKATETKAGKDRRGTLKQIQMPTYELPDLEENLDEASDSPQERRHSVDTPLSNNPELLMLNTSTPSVEFNTLEQNQELHQWWTDLFEL